MRFHLLLSLSILVSTLAMPLPATAAGLSGKSGVFKVVKPPKKRARKRLIINNVTRSLPPGGGGARSQRYAWFWRATSPRLDAADAERLEVSAATAGRKITGSGRRDLVQSIAKNFGPEITQAARGAKVSEALLIALVAAESAGKPTATSPKGAKGLGQLMPATAERFGVADAYNAKENLRASATYLSILLDMFGEDALLALAGYNAGEGAVARHKGVPPYNETRDYVPIVLSYYHLSRTLCENDASGPRGACQLTR